MQRRKFLIATIATTALGAMVFHGSTVAERSTKGFVVKAGQSRFGKKPILFGVTPKDINVSSNDADGSLTIFAYNGREKGIPPFHISFKQDEIFYVIEGSCLFELNGERHKLTAGDLILTPRKVPHAFAQLFIVKIPKSTISSYL